MRKFFCLHSHSVWKLNYVDVICYEEIVKYINIISEVVSPSPKEEKKTQLIKGFHGEQWKVRFHILPCFKVEACITMSDISLYFYETLKMNYISKDVIFVALVNWSLSEKARSKFCSWHYLTSFDAYVSCFNFWAPIPYL